MSRDNPVTNEEAYDQLAEALNAVRQKHNNDFFQGPNFGENCLRVARTTISQLQVALLITIDGIDPETLSTKRTGTVKLLIEVTESTVAALRKVCKDADEVTPEAAAVRVLTEWLEDNGYY